MPFLSRYELDMWWFGWWVVLLMVVYGWLFGGCGWYVACCWLISLRCWLWLVVGLGGYSCLIWY
ncbi:MAG: hypothetical protein ACK55Z_33645 [bacterium]